VKYKFGVVRTQLGRGANEEIDSHITFAKRKLQKERSKNKENKNSKRSCNSSKMRTMIA
jgi:hypothetical protein